MYSGLLNTYQVAWRGTCVESQCLRCPPRLVAIAGQTRSACTPTLSAQMQSRINKGLFTVWSIFTCRSKLLIIIKPQQTFVPCSVECFLYFVWVQSRCTFWWHQNSENDVPFPILLFVLTNLQKWFTHPKVKIKWIYLFRITLLGCYGNFFLPVHTACDKHVIWSYCLCRQNKR